MVSKPGAERNLVEGGVAGQQEKLENIQAQVSCRNEGARGTQGPGFTRCALAPDQFFCRLLLPG